MLARMLCASSSLLGTTLSTDYSAWVVGSMHTLCWGRSCAGSMQPFCAQPVYQKKTHLRVVVVWGMSCKTHTIPSPIAVMPVPGPVLGLSGCVCWRLRGRLPTSVVLPASGGGAAVRFTAGHSHSLVMCWCQLSLPSWQSAAAYLTPKKLL